jgi:hypothetical protein
VSHSQHKIYVKKCTQLLQIIVFRISAADEAAAKAAAAKAARWRDEPNSWVHRPYRWRGFTSAEAAKGSPQPCKETCDAEKDSHNCVGIAMGNGGNGGNGCYLFDHDGPLRNVALGNLSASSAGAYDMHFRGPAV